jgi:hypothetical protein
MRKHSDDSGQSEYLRGPGEEGAEAGDTGWRRHSQASTGSAAAAKISSVARDERAEGASWQRLVKGEGVQGGTI